MIDEMKNGPEPSDGERGDPATPAAGPPEAEEAAAHDKMSPKAELAAHSDGPDGASQKLKPRPFNNRMAAIGAGGALFAVLAAAGLYLAMAGKPKKTSEEAAATVEAESLAPAPIDIPGADTEPAVPAASAPTDKIFNRSGDALKSGAQALRGAIPSDQGAISELPPPPAATGENDALQKAAKDAAALAPGGPPNTEIDLSQPEAAIESLERAAAAALGERSPVGAPAAADGAQPLSADRTAEAADADRHIINTQAAEIDRLRAEVAALRTASGSIEQNARAALSFIALAEAARSGAPYREQLEEYADLVGATPLVSSLADRAVAGLPTLAALKLTFPRARNEALEAARRSAAKGPASRAASNLAALINLRPARPRAGDDPISIISRIEARLEAEDLEGALAEAKTLSGPPREALEAWMKEAAARAAAEDALRRASRAHAATAGAGRAGR